MSFEQTDTTPSHVTVTTDPLKIIKVRGKEVALPLRHTPKEQILLLALLSLGDKRVDDVLIQFKSKYADINGNVIFDWERGGWVE